MSVITKDTIQPSSGQALTIKDEGGTASITVATNGEATFAENIKITANKGINFSAYGSEDSDSATTVSSNLLDDYEEGTWTPTQKDSLGFEGTSITYSGTYTRIGNTVFINAKINGTNIELDGTNKYLVLEGIPFLAVGPSGAGSFASPNSNSTTGVARVPVSPSNELVLLCSKTDSTTSEFNVQATYYV